MFVKAYFDSARAIEDAGEMRLPFSLPIGRGQAARARVEPGPAAGADSATLAATEAPAVGDSFSTADAAANAFMPGRSDAPPPPGTIGAILVATGRLTVADVQRVVASQLESDAPFGETAVALGLASRDDVQFALSKQFALPCVPVSSDAIDPEVIAAFHPDHELAERMRNLRGQIAVRALDRTPPLRSIALLSSERGAGRTYIAANLATVFAQLGARTLLVDANLHHPRMHALFRLGNRNGLSSLLAGRSGIGMAVFPIESLPGLSVLPSGPTPPNPDDLIARPALAQLLRRLESDFDVILIDTPGWTAGSGARVIAAAAGAAVQLVQAGHTAAAEASALANEVVAVGTELIGAVMIRP
jgi:chain length determinant protein tyrosine kinase EpsG